MERLTRRDKVDGNEFVRINKGAPDFVVYEKLADYEDLEEQNRLLKLPCAVGDTAWIVFKGEIFKCMVSKFDIVRNGIFPMLRINETLETISVSMKTLEKTWFLTKEAAEAALEEMSE
ncbi:hypothetical protein V1226_26020 [Lachnospiraceae bacterium JLR.KK009]|nr:hypothetical protein C810_05184 [Lachnospiraceae bacterium A2]